MVNIFSGHFCYTFCNAADVHSRMPSNLETSGNLEVGPKTLGKVSEFLANIGNQGKVKN